MNHNDTIQAGDLAEIIGVGHFHHIITLQPDQEIQSHKGVLLTNDLIGKRWGSVVRSHNGNIFFILQPALTDMIKNIPRQTQIIYPKDVGMILLSLSIAPGQKVIEAGTGSGGLTTAFANAVGADGKIYSYDYRPDLQKIAKENVARVGFSDRVEFKTRDITDGFDEQSADALFLDVPNSYDYLPQVRAALKPGGFFGSLLPTTNQVSLLLEQMKQNQFGFTEVCEIMLRYYRTDPSKFRPADRMVGHTGYLIFGRPLIYPEGEEFINKKPLKDVFFENQD